MDPFFNPNPIDPDDVRFTPWVTEMHSEHMLEGTVDGELAIFTAHLHSWAATEKRAVVTAQVVFDWMIRESGIELL